MCFCPRDRNYRGRIPRRKNASALRWVSADLEHLPSNSRKLPLFDNSHAPYRACPSSDPSVVPRCSKVRTRATPRCFAVVLASARRDRCSHCNPGRDKDNGTRRAPPDAECAVDSKATSPIRGQTRARLSAPRHPETVHEVREGEELYPLEPALTRIVY